MLNLTLHILKSDSDRVTFHDQMSIEHAHRTARAHGTDADYYVIQDQTAKILEVAPIKDLDHPPPLTFRTLPPDIQEHYEGLDEPAKDYPLVWTPGGGESEVLRFKRNAAVDWATHNEKHGVNLNKMWAAAYEEKWPIADMMLFYRMMGYSVSGYMEVFMDSGRWQPGVTYIGETEE